MNESAEFLVFIVLVPIAVQLIKFAAEKLGKPIPRHAVEAIAAVFAVGYVAYAGGFAGLQFPPLPVFSGDAVAFIGAALSWLAAAVAFLAAVWGPIELAYSKVLGALFGKIGLA